MVTLIDRVVRERYTTDLPVNLNLPEVLDVSNDSHWASLDAKRLGGATAAFDGVIMRKCLFQIRPDT
jgi:hypothetical protein